jgi:hypothetical protein
VPGAAERGDRFGTAVAPVLLSTAADDEDSVWPQLMVSVPGEDVSGVADAGLVHLGENPGAGAVSLVPPVLQAGAGTGLELMRIGAY